MFFHKIGQFSTVRIKDGFGLFNCFDITKMHSMCITSISYSILFHNVHINLKNRYMVLLSADAFTNEFIRGFTIKKKEQDGLLLFAQR
jgi:hypothetical protein